MTLITLLALLACHTDPPAPAPSAVTAPVEPALTSTTVDPGTDSPDAPVRSDGLVNGEYGPDFELAVVGGKGTWKLSTYVNKESNGKADAAIVAFMASWCGYCAKSLPTLKELVDANGARLALVIVTVDTDDAARAQEAAKVKAAGLNVPVLAATPEMQKAWLGDSKSIPRFFFLNKVGEVLVQDRGFGDKVQPLMPRQLEMAFSHPTYLAR